MGILVIDMRSKNTELIRRIGMDPAKPDSFQTTNQPLMDNLLLWSTQDINLNELFQSFFGVKVKTKLTAILLDIDVDSWIGIAASWQHDNLNGQIRLDSKLTEFLLTTAFGESPKNYPFDIKKITPLEINIMQGFLSRLENSMKQYWEIDPKHPHLMDIVFLVWLVESDEGELGKIAFGIPASFVPKRGDGEQIDGAGGHIDVSKLANTGIKVPVDFNIGATKLSFNDIKSFEPEDLVVFENSDISCFQWHLGKVGLVLPDESHPIFCHEIENIEELTSDMNKAAKINNDDPLSSLPLELQAEFQKVFIPLKQVLDLKSGGVLPLGSVLDSELVLTAQGKPVAKGELVIVGNQFGMRITEILIGRKVSGAAGVEIEDLINEEENQDSERLGQGSFEDELSDLEEEK